MSQKEQWVISLLTTQSLPTSKLSAKRTSTLVPAGDTLTVCLWLSSAFLLCCSPLCICCTSNNNAVRFHYNKQGGIELLQPPRRMAGVASSIAGNLVRKGKTARIKWKSSLSATILSSFTGKEGKIFFLRLWSWYQEVHISGRICGAEEGLGSNKGLHSSNVLCLRILAFCPPFKEKHVILLRMLY